MKDYIYGYKIGKVHHKYWDHTLCDVIDISVALYFDSWCIGERDEKKVFKYSLRFKTKKQMQSDIFTKQGWTKITDNNLFRIKSESLKKIRKHMECLDKKYFVLDKSWADIEQRMFLLKI